MSINFIDEMIQNIAKEKNKLDEYAFLNFLKEEFKQKGISLTVKRTNDLHLVPLGTSNIIEVELDLSEHDKKKDAEIDKCKAKSEYTKSEMNKKFHEYLNEIDGLKCRIRELEELQEELPIEPIKVADYLISRKGKTNGPEYICELANYFPIYSISGLRGIAEHLLVYCNHAEEDR